MPDAAWMIALTPEQYADWETWRPHFEEILRRKLELLGATENIHFDEPAHQEAMVFGDGSEMPEIYVFKATGPIAG